ncbi:hypothetical protein M3J09_012558 [Ascochyta lentis]
MSMCPPARSLHISRLMARPARVDPTRMTPVQQITMMLGPNQSSNMPPMIGHMEFTIASDALMTPNCVLLIPSSWRSVFLSGPRLAPVHVCPIGSDTTHTKARILYFQGMMCAAELKSRRTCSKGLSRSVG